MNATNKVETLLSVIGDVVRVAHEAPPPEVNQFWDEVGKYLGLDEPSPAAESNEPKKKAPGSLTSTLIRPKKNRII
jgi:hypothetical protein